MFYRALELGMTAAEFWESCPRAIVTLSQCGVAEIAGRARKDGGRRTPRASGERRAEGVAPYGGRLARLPRG